MYLIIVFIPLISCLMSLIFGKFLNRYYASISTTLFLLIANLISYFIFYEVCLMKSITYIDSFFWIDLLYFEVKYSFIFDPLCSVMLIVITSISLAAHAYSIEYMNTDPHQIRFMAYLSLFTFFMIILVSANNLLQLFIGWEGVGICSYLLINFWYTRIQANQSAIKALLVNKVSDIGLMISFCICIYTLNSLDFDILKNSIYYLEGSSFIFMTALLLLVGAVGKSAQIGLHTWLPDAMEGPTPVSSLIHAATMVTAGVFLLCRCSFLFEYVPNVLLISLLLGSITSFFAASTGLFQNDLKKVIAYSTCSQLGYMFVACSVSGYHIAMFHLSNHAFFKALLFLTAGYIIHACSNEQDMRKLGGLYRIMPLSYSMISIASISLIGIPFMSGFYSKDVILEYLYLHVLNNNSNLNHVIIGLYWSSLLSLIGTTLYSIKLLSLTFLSNFNGFKHYVSSLHYSSYFMILPLFILSIYSIFIGYISKDMMIGLGTDFWSSSIFILFSNNNYYSEFLPLYIKLTPFFYSIYFIIISLILMNSKVGNQLIFNSKLICYRIYMYFNQKWYFDKLLNHYVSVVGFDFAYNICYKFLDKGLIEVVGPYGLSSIIIKKSNFLMKFQSGLIYHYAGLVLIFTILFIFYILYI